MGSNTTEAHPIIANRMKAAVKKGLKIIVVDPRKIEMTKVAADHLQIRVGSDIALINGMIHVIIEEGLYNPTFIAERTTGFEELKKKVAAYTPNHVSEICGIPEEKIIETARAFATAENGMIAYTLGITEHVHGVNNVFDIANLALLTGHIGKPGNGIMPLRGQNNVQGAGDMGALPNMLTGGLPLYDETVRKRFEERWGVRLNPHVGDTQTRTFQRIEEGTVKAVYIIGENPIQADVYKSHTRHLFEQLELLVVQDIFMHETAELAHVVLPARSWAESEGTFINTERRVQRVRKAVEAAPGTREDWEILCDLSTRLGYPMHYTHAEEIWNEIRSLVPEMYGGMSYERLDREGGLQYPCPTEDHPGTGYLHERFHQETFTGMKGKFVPVDYLPPPEPADEEYPFILTTGRRYEQYNTHTQTRHYASGVKLKQTEERLDIHPEDASRLGIQDGDLVQVSSRRGSVRVKAQITEKSAPGLLFMSFHWREVPTNQLTLNEYDPISGTAQYKACAVKVEKVSETATNSTSLLNETIL